MIHPTHKIYEGGCDFPMCTVCGLGGRQNELWNVCRGKRLSNIENGVDFSMSGSGAIKDMTTKNIAELLFAKLDHETNVELWLELEIWLEDNKE